MRVIENERVIAFDIDGTLILPASGDTPGPVIEIVDPYDLSTARRKKHYGHIKLLKNYLARGAYVIVWSKNGVQWAHSVLCALGIGEHPNLLVMTKTFVYVDDQECTSWMGERMFLDPNDTFGRE